MATTKAQLLINVALKYWQFNIAPVFTGDEPDIETDDPVMQIVLTMYDSLKDSALLKYPWRSTIKYADLVCKEDGGLTPSPQHDGKYKYWIELPDDFLAQEGFWKDTTRNIECPQDVNIIGTIAKTNLEEFTLGYVATGILEEELDPWLIDYLEIFIASEASDVAGQSPDRKNFLMQKAQSDFIECSNKDYRNANHDENQDSLMQFLDS